MSKKKNSSGKPKPTISHLAIFQAVSTWKLRHYLQNEDDNFYRCFPSSPTFTQSPLEVRNFKLPFHSVTKMGLGDFTVDSKDSDGFTR